MRRRAGLLPGNTEPVAYRPLIDQEIEEAVAAGSVVVDEVGSGIVSRLLLHNLGDRPVLLVDGEQLVGAKQNRILNTTILVPARTKLEIPVACVEQGRWGRSLGAMTPAETLFPEARRAHAEAVTRSVRQRGAHEADQMLVWQQVAYRLQTAASGLQPAPSPTSNASAMPTWTPTPGLPLARRPGRRDLRYRWGGPRPAAITRNSYLGLTWEDLPMPWAAQRSTVLEDTCIRWTSRHRLALCWRLGTEHRSSGGDPANPHCQFLPCYDDRHPPDTRMLRPDFLDEEAT